MNPVEWHYKFEGASGKPVILFLHGFMGSQADWTSVAGHFNSEFRYLCPDLPGHGRTRVRDDRYYTMEETAGSLIMLLDTLKIQQADVVGYSMGGRLALFLTVHYPERFTRLVLESASPGLRTEKERRQREAQDLLLAEKLEQGNFRQFLQKWYAQPLFESLRSHPGFDKLYRDRLLNQPVLLAKSLRFMGTGRQPSLWDYLPLISIPLLILAGEKDQKFRNIARRMKKQNPGFQVRVVKGCGHTIHFENEEKFVSILRQFFRKK